MYYNKKKCTYFVHKENVLADRTNIKVWVFHVLTVLCGSFTAFAYVHDILGIPPSGIVEFGDFVFLIVAFCVNLVFFIVLFFGMPFIQSNPSAYNTTTVTHTVTNWGEVKTSYSTPDDKAFWAMLFKRIGLIVLCWICSPVSHIVFYFIIPISQDEPFEHSHKAILIIASILLTGFLGTLPFWAL